MKIQAAPEGLTKGMVAEKTPEKGGGAGGDKAAAFGALLEKDTAKANKGGMAGAASGGEQGAGLVAKGDRLADREAGSDETPVLVDVPLDVGVVELDTAKPEGGEKAGDRGAAKDGPVANELGLVLLPPDLSSGDLQGETEGTADKRLEQLGDLLTGEPTMARQNEQGAVGATDLAMLFTLTSSLRATATGAADSERPGGKSRGEGVPLTATKGSAVMPGAAVSDLSDLLLTAPSSTVVQSSARVEPMALLDGVRSAAAPAGMDTAGPRLQAAHLSGENMASLANSFAALTPVSKQIQSALIQQVATGEFAGKVEAAALARDGASARVNNGSITVTLTPANLGEVTIKLVNRGDMVQIVLQTSTEEAAGQIMRDRDTIAELVQTLARKNANVVVQTGFEAGDGQQRMQEDGSRRGQSGEEGRAQSDFFNSGRDERRGASPDNAPSAHPDQPIGGEILI